MQGFFKAVGEVVTGVASFIDSRNKIFVNLSRFSYIGGDIVQGSVHLSCIVPFSARGVVVKIKGYERASWEETHTKNQEGRPPETIIDTHKEQTEFFCERIRVYPYEGLVQQGEYDFPFSYQLPPSLPGTYCEKGGHWGNGTGFLGEIIYFAKAKIDVVFKHDLKSKVCFVVNEKFNNLLQPSYGENSKTFLLTSGRLTAKVWLDKNAYFPGNTVIARLEANNTSVKPTNRLNVKVVRSLELHAHGHHKTLRDQMYQQQYRGFEPCFYGIKWLPFQVPINLQPCTTTSKLVRATYYFIIECDIPGAIDLQVELPTTILAPQWLFSNHPQAPPAAILPPDVSFRPPWQPDNSTEKCSKCASGFSLLKRRHHCRHCGRVFCQKCTEQKGRIPNLGYDEIMRVCDECFPIVSSTGGKLFQEAPPIVPSAPIEYGVVQGTMPLVGQ